MNQNFNSANIKLCETLIDGEFSLLGEMRSYLAPLEAWQVNSDSTFGATYFHVSIIEIGSHLISSEKSTSRAELFQMDDCCHSLVPYH